MNSSLKTTNFTEIRDTAEDVRSIYDATIVLNIPNMYQAILRKNDGS